MAGHYIMCVRECVCMIYTLFIEILYFLEISRLYYTSIYNIICELDQPTKSRPDMIFTRAASSISERTSLAMITAAIAGNAYNNNKNKK